MRRSVLSAYAVFLMLAVLLCFPHASWAADGTTTIVSIATDGTQGNGMSCDPDISEGGRYVVFQSEATSLVAGDTNGRTDIFVRDVLGGTTSLVNRSVAGTQANGWSVDPVISANARYVAYTSWAANLVAGDTNDVEDVFVSDLTSGTTERVSVDSGGTQANDGSYHAAISADGRYVMFSSFAGSLVPSDTNDADDVFVRDRLTGTTERVSVDSSGTQADGSSYGESMSRDGRYVVLSSSATNLVAGDTNGEQDIFVRDRVARTTTRVSVSTNGTETNGWSYDGAISDDGRLVVFTSEATSLVAVDTNGVSDVFVRDMVAGTTTRASVDSSGTQGNGDSQQPAISDDGRYVAFESLATSLVAGDTGWRDCFMRDLVTGTTTRLSVSTAGIQGDADSDMTQYGPAIAPTDPSRSGIFVTFGSWATNLVANDTNDEYDVFLRSIGAANGGGGDTYTITPTSGAHGTVSPASVQTVPSGASATFTITADAGYHIETVLVDGVSVGAVSSYTFTDVRADHTIAATFAIDGVTFDSVEGAGRYDTAVEASMRAFPTSGSADTIVLATGANWPDALGGSSLAGAYGGPLLLTKPDALSPQVLAEAARLNVGRVVILGSWRAVSNAVETALSAATVNGHGLDVIRVGGADRYETASKISSATVGVLASHGRTYDKVAFFATGSNFPDALAASPIAATKGWPILLVKPNTLSTFTEGAIASLDVTRGIMLGSNRAVTTVAENRLKALLPKTNRLEGATRYDTGIAIASWGVTQGLTWDGVAIAVGSNFPDALAGGVMQGKLGSVVLLTPGTMLNPAVAATLTANKATIKTVRYLGSTKALNQAVRNAVAAALK
jgi:putative cell wall-binding protein/Tol biopolymer transport system component